MEFFEEDPAADFLSREQEAIGDVLGGDNFELISDSPPPDTPVTDLDFLAEDDDPVPIPPVMSEPEMVAAPVMSEPEIVFAPPPLSEEGPIYDALSEAAEPESIRLWRMEQADEIAARDAEAATKTEDWRLEALKELDNWHSKQNEVLTKNKEANREAQEVFLKETQEQKPGAQWEKICKLCDFNPKNNRNCKDTARMRSIFLQLKQNPLVR